MNELPASLRPEWQPATRAHSLRRTAALLAELGAPGCDDDWLLLRYDGDGVDQVGRADHVSLRQIAGIALDTLARNADAIGATDLAERARRAHATLGFAATQLISGGMRPVADPRPEP